MSAKSQLRKTVITLSELPNGSLDVSVEFHPLINPQAEPTLSMKAAFSMIDSLRNSFSFPDKVITGEQEPPAPERN